MNPLALYIHIPFCTVKCGYCDFNTYAGLDGLKGEYAQGLAVEIANWGGRLPSSRVNSIFFGGGTPGELPPESIAAVIRAVRRAFDVADDAEVSLEVNPGTTTALAMTELQAAGVTRISIGVQRLDAAELAFLDRIHSPEAAVASMAAARAAGFDSISLDLIYGLPGETAADWQRTLEHAIELRPDHISMYALTVEEGTPLARDVERGLITPADPDLVAELYDTGRTMLTSAGFSHYELSNFARPGHRSRHNQVYWLGGEYVGCGAGAHGFLDGVRYENRAHPGRYLAAVRQTGRAIAERYRPNDTMRAADWLEARLRLLEGFEAHEFEAFAGRPLDALAGDTFRELQAAGVVVIEGGRVRLSERGLQLHSEVIVRTLVELERTVGPSEKLPVRATLAAAAAPS